MRKLIYILLLLFVSCVGNAQVIMDVRLESYVVEFVNEAKNRDVDALTTILSLEKIVFVKDLPVLGFYDRKRKSIYISSDIKSKVILRLVIFHEIGHAMGKKHTCSECIDIMSKYTYTHYKELIFKDEENWKNALDVFFKKDKI